MTSPIPRRESKVEVVFSNELALIANKKIRQFVVDIFNDLCPDYFWTVPCSTSGKYHPQYALGEGEIADGWMFDESATQDELKYFCTLNGTPIYGRGELSC